VVLLLAAGLYAFSRVPNIFFPPNEREMFYIDVYQPYGTDIRTTARRVARLEKFLLARPEVVNVGTFIGNPGPRWYLGLPMEDQGAHYARLVVNTKTPADVAPAMAAARRFIASQMPATRAVVAKLETGPPVGAAIQVRISGPEIATLYRLRDQVDKVLRTVPGIVNIRDDWGNWTKKLVVEVDQQRAKRAGFTSKDVALSLQTQISGLTATQFREGKEIIPVELRAAKTYREDLGRISGLNIYSFQDGRSLPLSQIADTRLDWQPSNIHRRDAVRTMTIKTDVEGRFASEAFAEARAKLEKLRHSPAWPAGYRIEYGGEFEESGQAQASIMAGLPLAMGLICFLLVWQFNSIVRPLIIVLTIPPMMIGVAFGLLVTDAPFGFMAMLGLISLTGIIINNAIILIDQIEAEKARGRSPAQAVVLSAQKRLRPIIMTSVTTIVGLIPLSLQGGEMWRPMANTLIFGLGFSTALTLILCPVLYTVFFRLRFQGFRWEAATATQDQG
jgi:multidrug efflux pump subunit AcrB